MTTTTQRLKPTQSSSILSSSDHRPTVVLCSSKDDHLLSQDICTLCGSLGKNEEGNLISCSQCGQCYHPFCVNIKGLKVVISKGWRCLECTVCETCGQPGDEAKLLLCDECELSCHTYCLNPPLEDVPQGAWKCHWCVICQRCKSHSPGINSDWQKNYTECGPCSSLSTCPKCKVDYVGNDLIIQCIHCSRWIHARCDSIRDEEECELASELGYTCLLCRPKDEIPLYIVHRKSIDSTSQNNNNNNNVCTNSLPSSTSYNQQLQDARTDDQLYWKYHDNTGDQKSPTSANPISNNDTSTRISPLAVSSHLSLTKQLQSEFPRPQSAPLSSSSEINNIESIKRPSSSLHFNSNEAKLSSMTASFPKADSANPNDIDGTNIDEDKSIKPTDDLVLGSHIVDGVYLSEVGFSFIKSQKLEPAKRQRAKRGTKVQKTDDGAIEDNNRDDDEENKLVTDDKVDDDGRKKRVRKLSKVGIGGFTVRQRGVRINKDDDFNYSLSNDILDTATPTNQMTNQTPSTQRTSQDGRLIETPLIASANIKPKRIRKKPKKKTNLIDQYPSYLQEAFFGKDLLFTNNEFKSTEEKYSETLNDCPMIDSQLEENDRFKSTKDSDSINRLSVEANKLKPDAKLTDSTEFSNNSLETTKTSELRQLTKEDDLMDVFVNDVQATDDSSETKKDAFDPDLLSTDFNLDMVAQFDSKAVEDLLNDIGPQTGTQKPNILNSTGDVYEQTSMAPTSLNNPNSTNMNHHQQPIHQNVQPISNINMPSQSTIHHIQQQQQPPPSQPQPQAQMISNNMSPHQVTSMHQQHKLSPNPIQHTQNHQLLHQMNYDIGGMPMHPSNVDQMNHSSQCNQDQNNPTVVNAPAPVLSPAVTLSPRTKMSSPCIPSSHRPPSTASSTGPMPSPAQQQMHHPLPPPSQQSQPVMSPMVDSETVNSQYQMPASPWTGSQPDMSRQYSSPHIANDQSWQSQSTSQDIDALSQSKKQAQNWESEEALGDKATKSAVLYANLEHPNLKQEYRTPDERFKQIQKLWRQLPADKRKPYVERARENRSASKVANKPMMDPVNPSKKPATPHLQHNIKPQMPPEGMHLQQQQQVHMNQSPTIHQTQDTRWKQPMPIEGQVNRFLPSPQSHRLPSHVGMDQGVCHPPEVNSPSLRSMNDPGIHYEHSPQPQMISPQTSSPRPQFNRPPMQQHSIIQVSRVRPPSMDPNRMQTTDMYAMPPSTPRPMPMQQRSPFSPQSPFQPMPVNPASSTPPITPRTPNEHQIMYQPNQHAPIHQNQPQQQQTFIEPQHQSHMQQPNQYTQIRQPHYPNQQRLTSPMHQPQYANHMPNQGPVPRGPMNTQMRPQMHPQQATYQQQQQPQFRQTHPPQQATYQQQQPQFRQTHAPQQTTYQQQPQQQPQFRQTQPPRYTSQHPEMHPHVSSPIQQNQSPQQMHQQRIQSPVMARQIPQGGPIHQAPRAAVAQTRVQHPIVQGQVPIHQIQSHHHQQQPQQQHPNQHQISHSPIVQPQTLQQPQQTHQMPMPHHLPQHPQQQTAPQTQNQQSAPMHYNSIPVNNRPEPDEATQLLEDEDDLKDLGADFNILEYADPEPEKGASTSAGKNNIELDAELEDYFDERETIEEKRTSDQMLPMGSQPPPQQHQIVYQQSQPITAMQQNQNFSDNQHHMGMQQHHHHQQQQQLQQQSQPQTNMIQPNQYSPQRQPHYVQQRVAPTNNQQFAPGQQQQHIRPLQPQHRHQSPRFHNQSHLGHDIHQQQQQQHLPQQIQQQTMVNPQQVHPQGNFMDTQQIHSGHMQQQYAQQQQQIYTNHQQHNQQMAPRRQMQPQLQQQHYSYQQQQHMQQVVMHDKNPIVGEAITSMEFTMYEQGSGASNEAVNLGNPSDDSNAAFSSNSQEVENNSQTSVAIHTQNNERSGSSCGQPQNQLLKQLLGNCSSADNPPNQDGGSPSLLVDSNNKVPIQSVVHTVVPKQLNPGIPTISFQLDSNNKNGGPVGSIIGGGQSLSGPTQLKGPIVTSKQPHARPISSATTATTSYEIKTYNVGQQVQPSGNMNIVRVQHQQHPTHVNPNPIIPKQPVSQIVPQIDPPQHAIKPVEQQQQPQQQQRQQHLNQSIVPVPSMNIPAAKKMKSQNGDESLVQPIRPINPPINLISAPGTEMNSQSSPRPIAKTSVTKRKNNDYIAERRAALEKEKTPPPREVKKPKRRIRGPNKRSRVQCDGDEVRPIDSNSNTSEASQQPDGLPGPGPKKRARKSQSKASKLDFENNESMMSSFAMKIHNELPTMPVKEPKLQANNNLVSLFACGDLNHMSSKLRGPFGKATPLAGTQGLAAKKVKRKPVGYYHEEFPRNLEVTSLDSATNRYKSIMLDRDCDSPGSIISGSSSEYEDALDQTNGLDSNGPMDCADKISEDEKLFTPDIVKYISARKLSQSYQRRAAVPKEDLTEGLESDTTHADINNNPRPLSPTLPMYIKLPTAQLSPTALENFGCDDDENNKENLQEVEASDEREIQEESIQTPDQPGTSLNMRLKDHGNVSVTLTLTNKEADGVKRVLSSLSQLIDYPIQASNLMLSPDSHNQDEKTSLGNSFRLLSGSTQNQLSISPNSHKDLKFNEQNYVPTGPIENNKASVSKLAPEPADVKPEFCKRCKTVVVDRGIRKNISEIPEPTIQSMRKSSIICEDQVGELIFCSVHCYAASIMCLESLEGGPTESSSDIKSKKPSYTVKAPPGLPPMSPMMEDDEDDISNNNRLQELDRLGVPIKSPLIDTSLFNSQRKKWADIRYTRWTPSYFEMNKSTSPISSNNDDIRDSTAIESVSQCSSSQLINHVDSSVDSNESDNSTFYSQSTSGKLASGLEDPFSSNGNQDIAMKREHQLTAGNRFKSTRDLTANKDILSSWPEGLDLIQVKPIKLIRPPVVIKKEKNCDDNSDSNLIERESTVPMDVVEMYEDNRKCVLCHEFGDGDSDGPARLLNLFIDGWVHLNCALWSLDVYELANGALMNVELACKKAMTCSFCLRPGATLKCFKPRCPNYYHFVCATKEKCSFYEDKSVQCRQHSKSAVKEMTSFVVKRRVYVNRDEQKQVAEMIQGEQQNVMRIGSLVFLNIGQLLPHQLVAFHDQNNIFPVGYRIIRYYWSYRRFNKRCKYLCTIEDDEGKPQFRIVAQEFGFDDQEFKCDSPQSVWRPIIDMIVDLRKQVPDTITTFPAYIRGEDLFGLTEPSIVRILESLPGIETLTDYDFKFGRSPLLELPLAINPTGCARTEPKLRTHFKRPYTIHTASSVPKSRLQSLSSGDSSSPYIKQFVHSKSSQYRKMKSEWRNNVVLARSRVQGLGLYAARDIEKHTMVIEYIGMLIRNEIAERYERIHEAHNRGIYMFRLDEDRVIDATLAGGLARYINHSCNPNCVAEAVEIDRERKILIIANRKILKGEELGYDYKLAIEDDQHKISCLCGAPTCKKWMN